MVASSLGQSRSVLNHKRRNSQSSFPLSEHRKRAREVDDSLPCRTLSIKPGTVRFSTDSQIFEIPNRACLSQEELNDVHMSREDQRRIYQEIGDILRSEKRGAAFDGAKFPSSSPKEHHEEDEEGLLGLETLLEQRGSGRSERMKTAISVIVGRQSNIDESWLQQHYRPLSDVSAKLARQRGIRDHEKTTLTTPSQIVVSR
jgi:hypothetical protein